MVDAPVSGAEWGAQAAELVFMVGGAAADLERVRPLLAAMGKAVFHVGGLGAGHAMKCLNNLVTSVNLLALSEGLAMGKRYGLDPEAMVDVLNASTGMSWVAQTHIKQRVLSRRFDDPFKLALMVKDIGIAMQLARATGTPAPLSEQAQQLWRTAAGEAAPATPASASWCAGSSAPAAPRSPPAPGRGRRHEPRPAARRSPFPLGGTGRRPSGAAMSAPTDARKKLRSAIVTEGLDRAPHRAFLRATGVGDEDMDKPFVGIVSQHGENTPCSMSLGPQADAARLGVAAGGAVPVQFTTVSVSDGVSMNHKGMRMSLVSRELIADSIEAVVRGPCLRRAGRLRRLRQDPARRDDGDGAAATARASSSTAARCCPAAGAART